MKPITDGETMTILSIYLQFDNTRRCFLLDVEQNIELSNPKPAQVTVYDYYETGKISNWADKYCVTISNLYIGRPS